MAVLLSSSGECGGGMGRGRVGGLTMLSDIRR